MSHGMELLDARYGLLVDNLLDLSHETFLHGDLIGTPEVAETPITTTIDEELAVVHVSRRMESVECPNFYSGSTGLRSPIDRWQDIEYHAPGYYLLHVRVAPVGSTPDDGRDDPQAAHLKVLYAITPIDDHRTMDFWAVCRDFAIDDADLDTFIAESNRAVVLQDVDALNLIEARLGDTWEPAGGQPEDRHRRTRRPPRAERPDRVRTRDARLRRGARRSSRSTAHRGDDRQLR